VKPCLGGSFSDAKHAGGFSKVHFIEIKDNNGIPVMFRKRRHRPADQNFTLMLRDLQERIPSCGNLCQIIDRIRRELPPPQRGPEDVQADGKNPGRESRLAAKSRQLPIDLQEGFLGQIFGPLPVPAETEGQIDQGALKAAYDVLECRQITFNHSPRIAQVRVHLLRIPLGVGRNQYAPGCINCYEKTQPAGRRMRHTEQQQKGAPNMISSSFGTIVILFPILMCFIVFTFVCVLTWLGERRKEREAFYRSEILKKLADSAGAGSQQLIEMMQQEHRSMQVRTREGQKLGGLILVAVGLALMPLLYMIVRDEAVWLSGLFPLLIGLVLLVYVYFLAPKSDS
jgi:hypothetical protein